jgi:hypothetical protein
LRVAERLVGYRTDVDLPAAWRRALIALWIAGVAASFGVTLRAVHGEPAHTREHIDISARLDDFTRGADGTTRNTVPAFVSLPGLLGAIPRGTDPEQPIRPVKESELRRGLCSPRLARVIRFEYPNMNERMSDARVEKLALAQHPEYEGRLCSLPVYVEAEASEIVKYTVRPRSTVHNAARSAGALLVALACAIAGMNVYFRGILACAAGD